MSFLVKRTYLAHLKKCSNQNSVQLKHVVSFASKTTTLTDEPQSTTKANKQQATAIKNRIIKMEMPKTEDDEQQQLVKFKKIVTLILIFLFIKGNSAFKFD